jgi:hypothetical protein
MIDSPFGSPKKLNLHQKHPLFWVLLRLLVAASLLVIFLLSVLHLNCDCAGLTGAVALLRVILIPKFGLHAGLDWKS